LQYVVERAVILSEGDTLQVDESWLKLEPAGSPRQREGLSVPVDGEVDSNRQHFSNRDLIAFADSVQEKDSEVNLDRILCRAQA
jgi:hypothetical protein